MIVAGAGTFYEVRCAEELASKIPNSELIILENAAHSMIFEESERFNQIVLEFPGRNITYPA